MSLLPARLLVFCIAALAAAGAASGQDRKAYVEGEVIVTFKAARSPAGAESALRRHALGFSRRFARISERRGRQTGLVRSTRGGSTPELMAALKADPDVEMVEPNYLRWVHAAPNDTAFATLWAMQNTGQTVDGVAGTAGADMKYLAASGMFRPGVQAPVVGVMDTGIDRHHADLAANIWTNPGDSTFNGIDDDGNGYVDDVHGFDFVAGTNGIADSGDHGTHVAGTIGAVGGNQTGVIGTNPAAKIMTLKVSSNGDTISTAAVLDALDYAMDMKGRGVNLVALNASFGGGSSSSAERSAIIAAGNAGIIFCAAAGNETANNDTTPSYPASYRLASMIVVAASDQNDVLGTFSNFGATTVDLAAPGVNINSTRPAVPAATMMVGTTSYQANVIAYSAATAGVGGTLHACGIGNVGEFPAGVSGNIALIQRGTLTFAEKVKNAMAAGARAAIIYNNIAGNFSGTLAADGEWIPAVAISQANGGSILAAITASTTASMTVTLPPTYQFLDGTSMATPQVAAAVSLAAMHFPEDTVAQRIQRILANVDKKTSLNGKVITGGRLNLQRMLDSDANTLPDWWEKLYFGQYTGVSLTGDLDHDGLADGQEYFAGTLPDDPGSGLRILSTQKAPGTGHLSLLWTSVPGKTYQIFRSSTLKSDSWTLDSAFAPATAAAGQTQMSYTDLTAAGTGRRYYRVQVVNP